MFQLDLEKIDQLFGNILKQKIWEQLCAKVSYELRLFGAILIPQNHPSLQKEKKLSIFSSLVVKEENACTLKTIEMKQDTTYTWN